MTNEQVMQAVNELTQTYNRLNENLVLLQQGGRLPTPLYSNPKIIWDGRADYQMTDEPITDILNVGAGQVRKYGKWHAQYMVTVEGKTAITNCTNQVPTNYAVIRAKPTAGKDGTFFVKYSNHDSWGHGIVSVWLADPVSKAPVTLLGSSCADKHADIGKSVVLSPQNAHVWDSRYYQWLGYNYNAADLQLDNEGYAYFALSSSVATWYIGGWALAERNTNFLWTPARIFDLDMYGAAAKSAHNGFFGQLTTSRFDANNTYKGVRLPYQATGKDLLIAFLCCDDYNIANPVFSGTKTQKVYRYDCIPCGNFARIRNDLAGYRWNFVHVSASEAAANTVDISGFKCLQLDIQVPECERAFYFAGAFTESEA